MNIQNFRFLETSMSIPSHDFSDIKNSNKVMIQNKPNILYNYVLRGLKPESAKVNKHPCIFPSHDRQKGKHINRVRNEIGVSSRPWGLFVLDASFERKTLPVVIL